MTTSPHPGAGRVLVVEDDAPTRAYVTRALERSGYTVASEVAAAPALATLDEAPWSALLVDIGLPGASGFDLVREARRRRPEVPIALMTADASVEVAVRALRSEVDDFLTKPISPEDLVAQVGRLVALRRTRTATPVERVLAIGAHPDDVEIGVGGVLAGHQDAGDEITLLTLSHGQRGGDRAARAAEAERAAVLLGADLRLGDLEDTLLPESGPTLDLIEAAVVDVDPTIVYTHTISDLHQDHRNVHRASMVAARGVPSVYCYESPSATVDFRPVRFMPIDRMVERKLALIAAYDTQAAVRSYLAPDLVRATSRYWGRYGSRDVDHCEPLEVVRERPAGSRAGDALRTTAPERETSHATA